MTLLLGWVDYATYNEDGYISGIRDDAPPEIKEQYDKYLKEAEEMKKDGFR